MSHYYLHDGHTQKGPFTLDELQTENIKPDTHVWHEGITDWTKAYQIESLQHLFKTPPPLHVLPPIYAATSTSNTNYTADTKPTKSASRWIYPILYVAAIILFVYIAAKLYEGQQFDKTTKEDVRNNIYTYVKMDNSEYRTLSLGGIYGLSITVSNRSSYMLEDVRVLVRYIKANGETWKNEYLDFVYLGPYKQITLRAPDSDRGTSIDYKIVAIKSSALGL